MRLARIGCRTNDPADLQPFCSAEMPHSRRAHDLSPVRHARARLRVPEAPARPTEEGDELSCATRRFPFFASCRPASTASLSSSSSTTCESSANVRLAPGGEPKSRFAIACWYRRIDHPVLACRPRRRLFPCVAALSESEHLADTALSPTAFIAGPSTAQPPPSGSGSFGLLRSNYPDPLQAGVLNELDVFELFN